MSDSQLTIQKDVFRQMDRNSVTREDAISRLRMCGIVDANGNYTAQYRSLNSSAAK